MQNKITKKDWNNFKLYITDTVKKNALSPEYKQNVKEVDRQTKLLEPKTIKHKLLWWTWETLQYPNSYETTLNCEHISSLLDRRRLILQRGVPELTLENCEVWKLEKHAKKNK